MKKILLITIIFLGFFSFASAENSQKEASKYSEIIVSTEVPGANCEPLKDKGYYKCKVEKGTPGVIKMLGEVIRWFTFLTSIVAVLVITIAGIMYSMGGVDEELKNQAKKWITGIIFGLIILFSSGYVLQLIAPWIYK